MKLTIGGRSFGQVADEKVQQHRPIRHELVEDLVIEGICRLIERYRFRPGAKGRLLKALGVEDGRSSGAKDGAGTKPRRASAQASGRSIRGHSAVGRKGKALK